MNSGTSNERENVQHPSSSSSRKRSATPEEEPPRKRAEACHDASGKMKLHHAIECSEKCAMLAISTSEQNFLNIQDEGGRTALHLAVRFRSTEVVKMLLTALASSHLDDAHERTCTSVVEMQDNEGKTALHVAVEWMAIGKVEMLLTAGTNSHLRDTNRPTPLVDIKNKYGRTALHTAASGHSTDIVEMLLAAGANTRLQDNWGWTPLHIAISSYKENIAEVICDADDGNILQDADGQTALHFAAKFGLKNIVRSLLTSRPRKSRKPFDNFIHSRKEATSESTASAMKRNGTAASVSTSKKDLVDIQDNYGMTALHKVARRGHAEIVEMLLSAGTNTRLQDHQGKTALHAAVSWYRDEITELLSDADNGNNLQDTRGNTALHCAAEQEAEVIVRKLLFNGVHPHMMNNAGRSPLWLALVYNNDNNVSEMIISFITLRDISIEWKDLNVREVKVEYCKKQIKECISEIHCMKETKVLRGSISFYDVATKHVRKLADYLENQEVKNVLLNGSGSLGFPHYADLIAFKVKKAETRRMLEDQCLEYFSTRLANLPYLPKTVIQEIFAYLSEREMRNFLAAFMSDVI